MTDLSKYVESVLSGLLAGGASAATTVLAFAKDIKNRLTTIETKLGSSEEPRTGLFQSVWTTEEGFRRFKRTVESWDEDPPEWAKRLISRHRSTSTLSVDHLLEIENRIDQKIRTFQDRLKGYEDTLEDIGARVRKHADEDRPEAIRMVSRDDYEKDSRAKAEELVKIRESLATANGLLRGVMAAMGYIDDKPKDPRTR